jgi:hypothetical protein
MLSLSSTPYLITLEKKQMIFNMDPALQCSENLMKMQQKFLLNHIEENNGKSTLTSKIEMLNKKDINLLCLGYNIQRNLNSIQFDGDFQTGNSQHSSMFQLSSYENITNWAKEMNLLSNMVILENKKVLILPSNHDKKCDSFFSRLLILGRNCKYLEGTIPLKIQIQFKSSVLMKNSMETK